MSLGIYLLFLGVYLVFAPGHFSSLDHVQVYQTTESLVERHNFEIEPLGNTIVKDGVAYASYGPVQSILSIPLYAVGREVDERASPQTRRYFAGETYWEGRLGGSVPIFFVSLFNQLLTPLLCVVFFRLCLTFGFSYRVSFLTTLAFGLSTTIASGAHEFYQHPLECLCLLTAAYMLVAHRKGLGARHVFAASALVSLGMLTRINVIVLLPSFLVYVLWLRVQSATEADALQPLASILHRTIEYAMRQAWRDARYYVAGAVPLAAAAAVWVAFNLVRFDDLLGYPSNLEGGIAIAAVPDALHGFLLSPGRSFFLYSPVTLLALFTYGRFLREHPAESLFFGSIALVYLCFYSLYSGWYGGPSWGPRYLMPALPFVVLSVAYALESGGFAAKAFVVLAVLGTVIQIPGMAVNADLSWRSLLPLSQDFPESFLFVPRYSPLYRQSSELLAGRNLDVWLEFVARNNGLGVFLATLAVPGVIFLASLRLLASAGLIRTRSPGEAGAALGQSPHRRGIV